MNKREYERMQTALNGRMEENLYVKYGKSGNWADGFRQGILVAKSIVRSEYESKQNKGGDTGD